MAFIDVHNLNYQYPTGSVPALRNVTFQVERGEFCAVVGGNGSGKSTLCYALRGLIPHFYHGEMTGEIRLDGADTSSSTIAGLADKVGIVIQNPFHQLSGIAETVFEELAFGLENLGVPAKEIFHRVEGMLELTHLDSLRDKNPYLLSGGQQQRLALASILVMEPEVLVLDEPTSQVDPHSTEELFSIIGEFHRRGITVVLVEHKIDLVAAYADHVILLHNGAVALDGTPEEVFQSKKVTAYPIALPQPVQLSLELSRRGIPAEPENVEALCAALLRKEKTLPCR